MILLFIADGRSMHTQRWLQYFAQRGHDVHVITYDPLTNPIEGVKEHVIHSWGNNMYLSFWPRQVRINRIVRDIKPDLIHAHFITKFGFHLQFIGKYPKILTAWGDDILVLPRSNKILHFFTYNALRSADLIYGVSNDIRNHIIADFGILEKKVRYLPFGVDTDVFSPAPGNSLKTTETITIFSNRRFFPVYDVKTLIEGFAKAAAKDSRLRLVLKMDGPDEENIRKRVRDLGIDKVVVFKRKTAYSNNAYSDVPKDYHDADIYITTSLSDGTPVSLLEAMASGVPCIATRVGGIPEWIEDKKNGLLISPGSPDEVAEAILTLVSNPALSSKLSAAARETVVRKGQWKSLMAQAEKDYLALIETYRKD